MLKRIVLIVLSTIGVSSFLLVSIVYAMSFKETNIQIQDDKSPPFTMSCDPIKSECDVYLSGNISSATNYRPVFFLIEKAPAETIINIHLLGNGGSMDTVYYFYNAISDSKATINTIVEGPVYSAHAFIAMLGNDIIIKPASFLMFHEPAVLDPKTGTFIKPLDICAQFKDKLDRGQSLEKKCIDNVTQSDTIINLIFKEKVEKFTTDQESKDIIAGHDVYISAVEMNRRIKNHVK